jgi:hypothetical protein
MFVEIISVLRDYGVFDVRHFLAHDVGAAKDLEPVYSGEF